MADGEKVDIVYHAGSQHGLMYRVTAPTGWDFMTPTERERWARSVLRRKDSAWEYVQINGLPY